MFFCDTHCHLNLDQFSNDLDEVVSRAINAGVERILIPGIDLITSRTAIELSLKYPGVFAAVGVHPHEANTWSNATLQELSILANHPKVIAIGEIGLDYYRNLTLPSLQQQILSQQLELAEQVAKPVILHSRQSLPELTKTMLAWADHLRDQSHTLANRFGVFHAFEGDQYAAQELIEKGFFIGVGGPVTYENASFRHQTTKDIPLPGILLETDAPFMTPHPWRGKRNEPAYIPVIARKIAELKATHISEVAQASSNAACFLFCW